MIISIIDAKDVLIVEDSSIIRKEFASQFQNIGSNVVQARNGDEALSLLKEGAKFDLILIDMQMPILGGECFVKKAKKFNILSGAAVVGVTAFAAEMVRGEELRQSIPEYVGTLKKVTDTDDLPASVEKKLHAAASA